MEGVGGLQRSTTSFRRQGSSGLVWDDKFLSTASSGADHETRSTGNNNIEKMQRSRSAGGVIYRAVKVSSPNADPPSPKVSGCGFCGFFGKPVSAATTTTNIHNHRRRRQTKSSKR